MLNGFFLKIIKMNKDILNKIVEIKEQLLDDGFIIEGVFGSYTKDNFNEFSDIDILYNLDKSFKDKYQGFKAIARLDAIQKEVSFLLNIEADLVQKSSLKFTMFSGNDKPILEFVLQMIDEAERLLCLY